MTPLIISPAVLAAAADPFDTYPGMGSEKGKGDEHGKGGGGPINPAPESAAYGCILVGLMVLVFVASRTLRKAHGCCGGGCGGRHS